VEVPDVPDPNPLRTASAEGVSDLFRDPQAVHSATPITRTMTVRMRR